MTVDDVDPSRVERLIYQVFQGGGIHYFRTERDPNSRMGMKYMGPPEDVVASTADFTVTLSGGGEQHFHVATVEMTTDFSTTEAARKVVEPYLQAWEIQSLLNHLNKHGDFSQPLRFEYQSAEVSNPTPISATAHLQTAQVFIEAKFPSPPSILLASPEVRSMWLRWRPYRAGRESLPGMGYYCLTVVVSIAGGSSRAHRQAAASKYAIDIDVLDKLGELTSEIGDEHERRKEHATYRRPYTPEERGWITRVVLALIERVGRVAWSTATGGSVSLTPLT